MKRPGPARAFSQAIDRPFRLWDIYIFSQHVHAATGVEIMKDLATTDPRIFELIQGEAKRQATVLRMIPSENYASKAVISAGSTCLTNKYSEGYPGKRYYKGQEFTDQIEALAIQRAKDLFGAEHANVQPYSGSPANLAVYLGILGASGKAMGMDLAAGGHLTHGAGVSFTGKNYQVALYGLNRETQRIDFDQVRKLAKEHNPGLIFAGATAYPREVDFAAFAEIAKEVGAKLVADISHISGLCATGCHMSPLPHADVVTSTTHKMLRGPRGGMILCRSELAGAIDRAVFPGLQGGPHNHTTAAIAVALHEAAQPEYTEYCRQVVKNAAALAACLQDMGVTLITGGTENHLLLIDVTPLGMSGAKAALHLEQAGIVVNANKIPFDPRPAMDPSGVRLGTPSLTTVGMKEPEMEKVAGFIFSALKQPDPDNLAKISNQVKELCGEFNISNWCQSAV